LNRFQGRRPGEGCPRERPRFRLEIAVIEERGHLMHLRAVDAPIERARGVLAERFGIEIAVADAILESVARTQNRTVSELAAAVVASCTDGSKPLPQRLYTNDDGFSDAA
jgi:ANTAR domain